MYKIRKKNVKNYNCYKIEIKTNINKFKSLIFIDLIVISTIEF